MLVGVTWRRHCASWAAAASATRPLPRGAQSGGVVVPPGSGHPAGAVAPAPGWWRRPTDLRHRRDPGRGAKMGGPSTGTRCVPAGLRWSRPAALRWISLMWLGHGAGRHWALPVLTVPPSTRWFQQQGRPKLTDWARQMVMQLAPPTPGAGGRQQLCREFAPLLPVPP